MDFMDFFKLLCDIFFFYYVGFPLDLCPEEKPVENCCFKNIYIYMISAHASWAFLSERSFYVNISKCILISAWIRWNRRTCVFLHAAMYQSKEAWQQIFPFLLCLISGWKQGPELNHSIATRCRIICDFMLFGLEIYQNSDKNQSNSLFRWTKRKCISYLKAGCLGFSAV